MPNGMRLWPSTNRCATSRIFLNILNLFNNKGEQKVPVVEIAESVFNPGKGWMGFVNNCPGDPQCVYDYIMSRESSEN